MIELGGLVNTLLGFGTAIAKDRLQRSELVITLLKSLGLDPDHPPADFTAVYQYALVEYGVGKPKPVLDIFRQVEIQQIFRRALDQNNPALLLKEGEAFLAEHTLGDELQALGLNAQRELYGFAAVFLEIAKRTRTPAEVLTNQRLDSLHRQLGTMQERLNRLPTLEGIRTEMARLAEQGVPAASESSAAQQCRAFALAQQMRGWFETLGYRFEPTEVWADDYFEWILNIPVRRNRFDRILVRGIAGEAGLRDVLALGNSVATQRTDEGWLVTARRISRAARDAVEQPENRHLDCYTFDELVDLDADFSGYIAWLEAEILRRGVATQYVPLACAKEELDPVTKQRVTVSRYDERDGWIDGYCDRWLDDSTKEHISVLGEFGTGKTWFAFHYAQVALQRYQEAKERGTQRPRLPLVITLRDYAKALNVENVLAGFFFTQHNIRLNSEVFDQLNRMGKLLLIFDGFDEMAAKVDRQQMINNFWELAKVVVPGAKVILTCRTEHFPEAQDGRALLNAELQASTANLTGETPQFEVLELEKFTDEQIRQVLAFQATAATVEQVMGNPQLLDLARRPVMTELILEALPDIEAGKPVDMSRVYLYAVRRKMERDIKAERTFTSLADKLYFMCELSWEMLSTDQMSLNYREFPDRIRKLFGAMVQEEKDLDHWHYDMMGQTMLIRNADGDYTPAHRSLLEFFVAYKFAAELGALAPDFLELAQMQSDVDSSLPAREYTWSEYFGQREGGIAPLQGFVSESLEVLRSGFGNAPITKAVIDLLTPIIFSKIPLIYLTAHQRILVNILKSTQQKNRNDVGYVGGNVATLLVSHDKYVLIRQDLSNTIIQAANFENSILRLTDFTQSDLTNCNFTKIFGKVSTIAFSPDGVFLAIGDSHNIIRLLEVATGQEVATLCGHASWVYSLIFSPDGLLLASGSYDQTVKIWNIEIGKCVKTLSGHTDWVRSVKFSPNGESIASVSSEILLWDVHSGECLQKFLGHESWIYSVDFSPCGKNIASASYDQTVRLWDTLTGECYQILKGHSGSIQSVAFSQSGELLASGGETIRLWDLNTGRCLHVLEEHTQAVWSLAFSHTTRLLASASADQSVKLWDISTGQCLQTLKGHTDRVYAVAFHPSDEIFASGSHDGTIRFWSSLTGECLKVLQGYTDGVCELSFSTDGAHIALGGTNKLIKVWQVWVDPTLSKCTLRKPQEFSGYKGWVQGVDFSPDNTMLVGGGQEIKIWDLSSGKCLKTFQGHNDLTLSTRFNSLGDILATGGDDSQVKLWSVETGECLKVMKGHTNRVWKVIFNSNDQVLASCSSDETIRIWDVASGRCLSIFKEHLRHIYSLAFSPRNDILASGGDDRIVRIWDVKNQRCIASFSGHSKPISALSFSFRDGVLASGSDDSTIRIWNIRTGQCLQILSGHTNSVHALAFNPRNGILASGSFDGCVRFWNVKTGECLFNLTDRPYEGMTITGVKGLTEAEKATLRALGAVEDPNV